MIKIVYENFDVGILRDAVLAEMLNFVMTKKEIIKNYYFMVNNPDNAKFLALLRNRKYKKLWDRLNYVQIHRKKMLKLFPAMLYFCTKAILIVVTKYSEGPFGHVDNGILRYQTFNTIDIIEIFIVKVVLLEYVTEMLHLPKASVLAKVNDICEDIV